MVTDQQGLEIVKNVASQHPELLNQNVDFTCFKFTTLVIEKLNKLDEGEWGYVSKRAGEGQYSPPNFVARPVRGVDGNLYIITGASHDAIFNKVSNIQIDTLGGGNDGPDPILDGRGNVKPALAQWLVIPQHEYRAGNPWISVSDFRSIPPQPKPIEPVIPSYPGDDFFWHSIGDVLEADYKEAKQTLNAGSATWFARPIWDIVVHKMAPADAVKKHRNDWRTVLKLPPIS